MPLEFLCILYKPRIFFYLYLYRYCFSCDKYFYRIRQKLRQDSRTQLLYLIIKKKGKKEIFHKEKK